MESKQNSQSRVDLAALHAILDKTLDKKAVFGTVLSIQTPDIQWTAAAGNLAKNHAYFIASTTKLYVTAIILKLKAENRIGLNDKISTFLSPEIMDKLHVYKGVDYSDTISIKNLLAHTSGLPDYFEDKGTEGKSLLQRLQFGADQSWTFDEVLEMSKKMSPKFAPNSKNKAHYSDYVELIIHRQNAMFFLMDCMRFSLNF